MIAIFKNTMRRNLWHLLGWGISFGLVAFYLMVLYQPMVENQAEIISLYEAYGENFMAFFGGSPDILSPGGYMDFGFFSYIPIIAGIFSLLVGSGLVLADEEQGTLDLVLAYPVTRTAFFWGRILALTLVTAGIMLLTWLGFAAGLVPAGWDVNLIDLALPHLTLFAILMLFGSLALFLSLVVPQRSLAASLTGMLLLVSYFVTSLAKVNEDLAALNRYSPLKYYQGGQALNDLHAGNLLGLLAVSFALILLSWLLFQVRDIRVSGTASWRLPSWLRKGWRLSPGNNRSN